MVVLWLGFFLVWSPSAYEIICIWFYKPRNFFFLFEIFLSLPTRLLLLHPLLSLCVYLFSLSQADEELVRFELFKYINKKNNLLIILLWSEGGDISLRGWYVIFSLTRFLLEPSVKTSQGPRWRTRISKEARNEFYVPEKEAATRKTATATQQLELRQQPASREPFVSAQLNLPTKRRILMALVTTSGLN